MLAWINDNRGRTLGLVAVVLAFAVIIAWAAFSGAIGVVPATHPATCTRTLC